MSVMISRKITVVCSYGDAEAVPRSPNGNNEWDWDQDQPRNEETGKGEHSIAHQPSQRGEMLTPQRPLPLDK